MAKRVEPREKIVQRSVGFTFRQIEFINENQLFKPDQFLRDEMDRQIVLQGAFQYLSKNDERRIEWEKNAN